MGARGGEPGGPADEGAEDEEEGEVSVHPVGRLGDKKWEVKSKAIELTDESELMTLQDRDLSLAFIATHFIFFSTPSKGPRALTLTLSLNC